MPMEGLGRAGEGETCRSRRVAEGTKPTHQNGENGKKNVVDRHGVITKNRKDGVVSVD
jgi:hypothetical protein